MNGYILRILIDGRSIDDDVMCSPPCWGRHGLRKKVTRLQRLRLSFLPMADKRASPGSPSERPSKRLALSSPEEGEVDDKMTPPDAPPQRFQNSSVAYPFKKAGARSLSRSPSRSPPKHRLPTRVSSPREEEYNHNRYRPSRRGHDRYVPERHDDARRVFHDHREPYDTRRDAYDSRRDYDSYRPGYAEAYEPRKDGCDARRDHRRRSPQYHSRPLSQASYSPPRHPTPGAGFSPQSLQPPPPQIPPPPPPPPVSTPPPPPPDILPGHRDSVKFSISKRDHDGRRMRSDQHPPPCKPNSPADAARQTDGRNSRASSEAPRKGRDKASPRQDTPKKPRRPPATRTASQERSAYDRVFVGCGRMDAYDVTTKVGEGTFG